MRLTVNLEPDLYSIARALAQAEDCSISVAVNRLIRRAITTAPKTRKTTRNGLAVSRGHRPVTAELVKKIESEDDRL
ncbi:MAG TPA: hypothetical protein VFY29_16385 [Terriglobia bacterium]|nr:hypothetical protein [Terriglobia bacterium]